MSDLVYAPCEHGYWDRHLRLEGGWCDGRRPLGTVEDIERALSVAAAYDNAEREWHCIAFGSTAECDELNHESYACGWVRMVPEIGDTDGR